jgi:hypothetical protein
MLLFLIVATMIHLSEGLWYVTQSQSTVLSCRLYSFLFLTGDTRIHLSEGLWYATQSLSGPHMGEGGMLPCTEGSC